MRRKIPDLAQALTGDFNDNHAVFARAILQRLDMVEAALAQIDEVIRSACQLWAHEVELLQTIPGVGEKVAQVIIAETGGDMSKFPTASHLCSGQGSVRRCTSRPANAPPRADVAGTSGSPRSWSKLPAQWGGCTRSTTSPPSTHA